MKASAALQIASLLVLVHCAFVNSSIIDRDFFGQFTLEQGSLPFCLKHLNTYASYPGYSQVSRISFSDRNRLRLRRESAGCRPLRAGNQLNSSTSTTTSLIRGRAPNKLFGPAASSLGDVFSVNTDYECATQSSRKDRSSLIQEPASELDFEPTPDPEFGLHSNAPVSGISSGVKVTVAQPTAAVTVKGIRLTLNKRYIFFENDAGSCIYSAQSLKRLQVQATYSLVRSPFLKRPPSYCKSTLTITGNPGVVDASQLLFDGRPSSCLKGKVTLIEPPNVEFPMVTKLVQNAIPYYGFSELPLRCGKQFTYVAAAEISKDGALGNIFTIKGAKYFGLVNMPSGSVDMPSYLNEIGLCLYSTAVNNATNGIWGDVKSALS